MLSIEYENSREFEKISDLILILEQSISASEKYVLKELVSTYHEMLVQYYNWWISLTEKLKEKERLSNAKE